jgi:hypothetical protein
MADRAWFLNKDNVEEVGDSLMSWLAEHGETDVSVSATLAGPDLHLSLDLPNGAQVVYLSGDMIYMREP